MDEPIAFEKWLARAEATVTIYVGFDVVHEGCAWSARGHVALAHADGATLSAVTYTAQGVAPETRRYPCTKDGGRLAGEQIAEFLRTGRLAHE